LDFCIWGNEEGRVVADSKTYSFEKSIKELGEDLKNFTKEVKAQAKSKLQELAVQTHAKIVEKAGVLQSTRHTYIENLGMMNEGDELYVVYLKKQALWLEDGVPPGEMIDRILDGGKPAKVSKKGNRYKTIPFKHSKQSNNMSLAQQRIAAFAKAQIQKAGLDKVITNAQGRPIIGRAATLNIQEHPPGVIKKDVWRTPLLAGLSIYQREVKHSNQKGLTVKRDIFTFRVISEAQKGSGLWVSKGFRGIHAFQEVEKEVDAMWNKMITEIVDEAASGIGKQGK
jgi:hypothetical protein